MLIIVTRPQPQAGLLCDLITQQQMKVICAPLIQIEAIKIKVNNLPAPDYLLFISQNAVEYAKPLLHKMDLKPIKIIAIGQATAKKLMAEKINIDIQALPPQTSEMLLKHPELRQLNNAKIWIIKGENGREKLKNTLIERGACVQTIDVYRRQLITPDLTAINPKEKLIGIVTSEQILNYYFQVIIKKQSLDLKSHLLIVISTRLKIAAINLGFKRVEVAKTAANQDILASLLAIKLRI